jgi:hypothetical protein
MINWLEKFIPSCCSVRTSKLSKNLSTEDTPSGLQNIEIISQDSSIINFISSASEEIEEKKSFSSPTKDLNEDIITSRRSTNNTLSLNDSALLRIGRI